MCNVIQRKTRRSSGAPFMAPSPLSRPTETRLPTPPTRLNTYSTYSPRASLPIGDLPDDFIGRLVRPQSPPARLTKPVVGRAFAVPDFTDQLRSDESDALGILGGKPCIEGRFVGLEGFQRGLQTLQRLVGEARADPADELQATVGGYPEHQCPDTAGPAALPLPPASDDDFLGVPDLVLDPRRRPSTGLVGGVPLLGDDTFPALLARMFERLRPVARQRGRHDDSPSISQRLQQPPAVGVLGPQQRSTVQMQDVERPELDAGRSRTVLHLAEAGHTGRIERDRLAVEDHVVVGEIGGQRLELRILGGDIATAP